MWAVERDIAGRLGVASPVIAVILTPLVAKYLLTIIFLKQPEPGWNSWQAWHWTPSILIAAAILVAPLAWLAALQLEKFQRQRVCPRRIPAAAIAAAVLIVLSSLLFVHPRLRWFYVEWAKLRAPNPSFARNTLFWKNEDFPQAGEPKSAVRRISLVGSSRVYQGIDQLLLAELLGESFVEKMCLAGLGPMQYLALVDRVVSHEPTQVVLWLSEFDLYREDTLPIGRLRWCASWRNTTELAALLAPQQKWENRGALADLAFAAAMPWWREREHLRRTVFGYWWNVNAPTGSDDLEAVPVLARSAGLEEALVHLQRNVRRTTMVEANYQAIASFAQHLRDRGTDLVVFEGLLHPRAVKVCEPELREEARGRLAEMAAEGGFRFVPSEAMPAFGEDCFGDAYHLNKQGRERFTKYLAEYLREANDEESVGLREARLARIPVASLARVRKSPRSGERSYKTEEQMPVPQHPAVLLVH